jgi:uncharacterized protein (TIGR02001 family)
MKGKTMFKKTLVAGVMTAALATPGIVLAADAAPAEAKSPHTLTGNVGLFSQYIFRGMTQTNADPALQGGFDYSHASGFYAGTWASNISWLKENFSLNGSLIGPGIPNAITGTYESGGSLEWDFYGGYKWSLPQDFTIDLGTLYYWYPGKTSAAYNAVVTALMAPTPFGGAPKADTWEVYGAVAWKWLSAKYSYSVLDHTFANLDSRGSWYLDLSANPPLGDTGLTLNLHWGWQKFAGTDPRNVLFAPLYGGATPDNNELFSYKDYKIGLSYALPKDFTIGAFWSKGYSYNKLGWGGVDDLIAPGFFGPYPRDMARGTGTVFVQKTF